MSHEETQRVWHALRRRVRRHTHSHEELRDHHEPGMLTGIGAFGFFALAMMQALTSALVSPWVALAALWPWQIACLVVWLLGLGLDEDRRARRSAFTPGEGRR